MSDLKAGDLCLITGSDNHPEDIGKSGILLTRILKSDWPNAEKLHGDAWQISCVSFPRVCRDAHLMKISGHKEPEQVTKQEGVEA